MEDKIINVILEFCNDENIRKERDIDLFCYGLLDSLGFTLLLVAIEENFGVEISPTEIEREDMNTVNKIITQVKRRLEE